MLKNSVASPSTVDGRCRRAHPWEGSATLVRVGTLPGVALGSLLGQMLPDLRAATAILDLQVAAVDLLVPILVRGAWFAHATSSLSYSSGATSIGATQHDCCSEEFIPPHLAPSI